MNSRQAGVLVFATLLLSYAWFFQGGGYNPNSRLALTRALVERGTLAIDAYPVTGDWAEHAGRRYTNKAPGLSFLAAPAWALTQGVAPEPAGEALSLRTWLVNAAVNALPAACLGWLLFGVLGRLGAGSERLRAAAALVYGLGTLAFPYATAFYAHQPAAAASFAAFAALLAADTSPRARLLAAAAGAAAGLAVALEVSCVLVAAGLGLWLLADSRRRRHLPLYVAGGLPFALALGLYTAAAFGSPWSLWFEQANPTIEIRVEGRLFGAPSLVNVIELLGMPYRGLFYTSPVLLLAFAGWPRLRRAQPAVATLCAALPLAFLLLISSFHAWYGGWAPGPRYLVPALPFLFVPVAFAFGSWPRIGALLAALSVASMLVLTSVAVEIPSGFADPLLDFALPRFLAGELAVNPALLDVRLPPPSYALGEARPNGASFNVGELLGASGLASIAPLVASWCVAGAALAFGHRRSR
ncbi:MAG: hypothetical protein QF890_00350 [Myxococcota bacterium]|nr:hypothetical protein [Deltaproteobacteria bacterium]MCP4244186.1 hypothetical protein [bacterium]MDP6076189.1 hypothetical protein [Myxococcota bacterium]MDP6242282.1 hypothetical protein [Myxococcota bacterium]MDP7076178.1 hypothetical protein [Myxococcota bacterium]